MKKKIMMMLLACALAVGIAASPSGAETVKAAGMLLRIIGA